jgi:hypothetical protein
LADAALTRAGQSSQIATFWNTQTALNIRIHGEMDQQLSENSGDIADRSLRYTKEQFEQIRGQTEDYVRENPTRAVAYALVAGLVLDRLPVFRIIGGLTRLSLMALKPAILIYGATKLYQATKQEEA